MMHEIFINIGNIRYSNFPINSNPIMPTWQDEHGRLYCEAHRREVCDICCMSFDMPNRMQEEEVGILPKRTEVEKVADFIALIIKSLRDMHNMVPLPNEEVWAGNRGYLNDHIIKLRKFRDDGDTTIEEALNKGMEKEFGKERGILIDMGHIGEDTTTWDIAGPEGAKVYQDFINDPAMYNCDHCKKSSDGKLSICAKCKKVCYCSKDCQTKAWKEHKKACKSAFNAAKFFGGVKMHV